MEEAAVEFGFFWFVGGNVLLAFELYNNKTDGDNDHGLY